MILVFGFLVGTLIWMELVYHFGCFGFVGANPLLAIPVWILFAGIATLATGFMRKKANRNIMWIFLAVYYLLFASQLVYFRIFKQPMLLAAVTNGAKDAVTNYWREALYGILQASGYLLLFAVPLVAAGLLLKFKKLVLKSHTSKERIINLSAIGSSIVLYIAILMIGYFAETEYYEQYGGFYDPEGAMCDYGVTASVTRDLLGDIFPEKEGALDVWTDVAPTPAPVVTPDVSAGDADVSAGDAIVEEEPVLDTSPNVLPIDFDSLIANADSEEIVGLAEYMQSIPPTNRNEYTGMFEGYNLIYLTAEGFSPYAVDEELTPTLYKMIHSGFVFENYYVPLWQTSTSDGEYVNCTGLIPDQQFSMRRSQDNAMPFTLPAFFAAEGVNSYAFHNNSLSYYERNYTHPNLGYNFQACKLGDLDEEVWGGQVFEMENAGYWPTSDLNMMEATIPQYINEDRFHVYYMTISGHMNYNFTGNRMSSKHKDDVAALPYSEEGRAYIACNMELDLALEYLIEQLDAAGKLENTVICLSADHYPYAMDVANLEELAGKPLDGSLEIYRNNLILWNSEMETVTVEKTASSLDILPTLLNLFGFEYDSRLYVGRDILSDSTPLVIFSDRSFITDRVSYYKKSKEVTWFDGTESDDEYYEAIKKQVKGLYNYSAGILNNDFYRYVEEALPEEYHSQIDPDWIAPKPPAPEVEETETTVPETEGDSSTAPTENVTDENSVGETTADEETTGDNTSGEGSTGENVSLE
ncbi:MAG: LTA synthase family protein [Lachnospiraceae bacterium]|nr:LTA synthase family protein [Lachnospiraceae bacterium]